MTDDSQRSSGREAGRRRARALCRMVRPLCGPRLALAFVLLFSSCLPAHAQDVVDQMIALVNEEVITKTDLLWSLALDPKSPSPAGNLSSDVLRQKLDVMIDQRLIWQEASRVPAADVSQEEINQRRTVLIKQFPNETAFRQRVESVGLTPQRIDDLIREMILIERFAEFRFRSFVLVTEQDVQTYYNDKLAAEMRNKGQVPPSLDQVIEGATVREQINAILKQEKINQEIDRWMNAARQRADIVLLVEL
jgi:hypothetical protein